MLQPETEEGCMYVCLLVCVWGGEGGIFEDVGKRTMEL